MAASEPVSKAEALAFGVHLLMQSKTHKEWLIIVRFGIDTFLGNQRLLFELIVREARRQKEGSNSDIEIAEVAAVIFEELGLRLG